MGRCLAALLFLFLLPGLYATAQPVAEPGGGPVWVMELTGTINPGSALFVEDSFRKAVEAASPLVVIRLDTPGGLVESMRAIVQSILASPLPVAVYVAPAGARATSAGAFIVLAAPLAAMAPATHLGAAHPVGPGGKEIEGSLGEKAVSDLKALAESLAKRRGRDPEPVRSMVVDSASFDALEAREKGLIDVVARDLGALLTELNGREVDTAGGRRGIDTTGRTIHFDQPGLRERLLSTLADPNLAYILMMIGLAGLFFELSHPGAVLPGVVGSMALILAFFAMSSLSVSYTGLALILLAVIFFIAEIKVTSYGLLSVAGALCIILGSIMLFDSEDRMMRVSLSVLVPTAAAVILFFAGLAYLAGRAQLARKTTGMEGILGQTAVAVDGRRVKVMGELWQARSAEPLRPGQEVEVTGIEGLTLEVKPREP